MGLHSKILLNGLLIGFQLTCLGEEFVTKRSNWSYQVEYPGNEWTQSHFDASEWLSGRAPIGFNEPAMGTLLEGLAPVLYLRKTFTLPEDSNFAVIYGELRRDDGCVIYLDGTEIYRSNMPEGEVLPETFASNGVPADEETKYLPFTVALNDIIPSGSHLVTIELHQESLESDDQVFDLSLDFFEDQSPALIRRPYLQMMNHDGVTLRWRTNFSTESIVRYGTDKNNLTHISSSISAAREHTARITDLSANTQYYYSVGNLEGNLYTSELSHFTSSPMAGEAMETDIWVIGDPGVGIQTQKDTRDSAINLIGIDNLDMILTLGDNAYQRGTDWEFQRKFFDIYNQVLETIPLWPCSGNHDEITANIHTEQGGYYDIFDLPTKAEIGGIASGTESYYSFDYANIHFVCLSSFNIDKSAEGEMAQWVESDLANTSQKWKIVFFHIPPYTKGSHNSDREVYCIEMRENIIPILERYNTDLVLSGHSHNYERSFLLKGHFEDSSTFSYETMTGKLPAPEEVSKTVFNKFPFSPSGTLYVVAGSTGRVTEAALDHPVHSVSLNIAGSLYVKVKGNRLEVQFIDGSGNVLDDVVIHHADLSDYLVGEISHPIASNAALSFSADHFIESYIDSFSLEKSLDLENWQAVQQIPISELNNKIEIITSQPEGSFFRLIAQPKEVTTNQ